ncbi:MAG: outer membrane beta-barrel protein [Cyclobacteriaceae bacterium]|nr:outer membrane beta-barrel protein [Cyclobacteriaceae bacterium]
MREFFVATLSIAAYTVAYSQSFNKGYIIEIDGSRIDGLIYYQPTKNEDDKILFKKNGQAAESIAYSANQIDRFYFEVPSREFVAVQTTGSTRIFAEVLIRGNASLFNYQKMYFLNRGEEWLNFRLPIRSKSALTQEEAVTDKVLKIKEVGNIKVFLGDCEDPTFSDFSASSVARTVEKYNLCKGGDYIKYKYRPFKIGAAAGLNVAMLNFDASAGFSYLEATKFSPSFGYSFGLNTEFSSGKFLDKVSLNFGLQYAYNKFYGEGTLVSSSSTTQYNEVTFEVGRIKVPTSLKFYTKYGQQGLSFQAGIEPYFVVNSNQHRFFENYLDGMYLGTGTQDDFLETRNLGGAICIVSGYDFMLNNKLKLNANISFGYDFGFIVPATSFNSSIISLALGTVLYFW